jgi:hypothetical protein
MKNKKGVNHRGTGWGQHSSCPCCPMCPRKIFEVGQRNLLISRDCLGCPRCPTKISNLQRRAGGYTYSVQSDEIYKQIRKYLGHLGQVGQLIGIMMKKLSQEIGKAGTALGQSNRRKRMPQERGGDTPPPAVVLYLRDLVSPRLLCWLSASSSKILIASDLEFTRFSNRKSSSLFIRSSSATKIILGFSVGMHPWYHIYDGTARDVDKMGFIGYKPDISFIAKSFIGGSVHGR